MPTENVIQKSAALRGKGKFDDAIELIERSIHNIDPDTKVIAWLEAFRAAKEKGDQALTRKYAELVASEEPDMPSVQDYL
ncbi:hypothetical protein [Marinobacter sp. Arc7-DN-1]|uniref:hypothetical protein n=1 Tax=Marinobacter sp. Arc7-DN-1 TaxID=2304594 RepID=UPI000E44A83A|nr:hypothetical protein [Marinobacter sp. Arc7-DN-1]AXS84271.1 hypothetical protein D0851_15270 [Marinobacter sp. Arc7-DN-1]